MFRPLVAFCVAAFFAGLSAPAPCSAQDGPQPGTIKKIDREKSTVTISHAGKEDEFQIADSTRLVDAQGREIEKRAGDERLKEGTPVFFKPLDNDPRVLWGMKIRGSNGRPSAAPSGPRPTLVKVDTSAFKPLDELGQEEYQGYEGGFYPGGVNERPNEHEAAGRKLAAEIRPLDSQGKPNANGKIVLLTVGMSNTQQASQAFKQLADRDAEKNPQVVIVNGAQGGMTADRIANPDDGASGQKYWSTVDERLQAAGLSRDQVQVVWIKQAEAGPTRGFPKYAQRLQADLAADVGVVAARFPNVKLCYLSPRTYGGYAKTPLNPEPYAYESGFSVKWLIEQQLRGDADLNFDPTKGPVKAPWLSWGANLWANGPKPNSAGLSYEPGDFSENDGTHESSSGQQKVGQQLLNFFKTDSTTKSWFVRGG